MRQLYPLRPLTEAGRVLLCVAAAVFAALVLVAWTVVPADELGGAPVASVDSLTSAVSAR